MRNRMNNDWGDIIPPKLIYPKTTIPEYSNSVKAQENDLKSNFIEHDKCLQRKLKLRAIKEKLIKKLQEIN